ncbi:MBL fold metallo-hydrolase [Baekduia soli]|uniref:MBL fold metallo-hydrolase n=1 Tax=Baekduia soli TaxID=496014 RepID=A0A5B8TZL7_9ACTN|nr:MBL fold metallo-hydrolase [Baekduia soli]QEC46163.1 MBL fold metallo-hydrolase [Baekduia soli]
MTRRSLPREIAPGLHWLGDCIHVTYAGTTLHSLDSLFVLQGSEAAVIVDAGLPNDLDVIERQLDEVERSGGPPVRYVWPTHQETPHAGGVARWLDRYPDAVLCGDVRDYHLIFPELAARLMPLEIGERISLGDSEVVAVAPVFYDLPGTQWLFDTRRRALFSGDGFAYAHYHLAEQCSLVAEEADDLDIPEMTGLFSEASLRWSKYRDMEPLTRELQALVADLGAEVVAPGHGLPILDPVTTFPRVIEGLLLAHKVDRGTG